MKKYMDIILFSAILLALLAGILILGYNYIYFLKVYIMLLVIGLIFFPINMLIFKKSYDNGWIFSKLLGIATPAIVLWNLSYLKIMKFSVVNIFILLAIMLAISLFIFIKKKQYKEIDKNKLIKILLSEFIFIIAFITWTSIRSHNVEITPSTEQFMNYGFINKLMYTDYLPAEDIWFSGNYLNYYYFGQYIISFMGKLSFTGVNELYNIMFALVCTFTFVMPFSIGYNLGLKLTKKDRIQEIENKKKQYNKKTSFKEHIIPFLIAILTGLTICIGGTLHFPIYKYIVHDDQNTYEYWDAVRYISDETDTVATDIPAYSNVVGDLHAHYIDTMFSFTTLAILVDIILRKKEETTDNKLNIKRFLNIQTLTLGIMLGIQKMTNFWAFPVYTVVISVMLIGNYLTKYKINKKTILETIIQILLVILIEELVTFTFTDSLYISATKVLLTHRTSPLNKMIVLWGIQTISVISLIVYSLYNFIKNRKQTNFKEFLENLNKSDVIVMILGLCAIGLIIIPEIVYVKDIYGDDYKRFNTVFKLTYEAFILFGLSINYIIIKFLVEDGKRFKFSIGLVLIILQISTLGYGLEAIMYTTNGKSSNMANSLDYIKQTSPDDYNAIKWIQNNIDRESVILESTGQSYQMTSKISVFTANPTVLGWDAHEWVWRADRNYQPCEEQLNRRTDVYGIYTYYTEEETRECIEKYNISYIYIGQNERDCYSEYLDIDKLKALGEIVYNKNNTYLIRTK